ncbi:MAG: alpha/beta fold hydrolase [Chloroflexi bacterium]|nr:alpha/beta fold hydrolase [Chloroflexota bacterium]MCY3695548.1 alpha/beta fold hydrolase [Chloroflexota bacterium]
MSSIDREGVSIYYEASGDGPAILLSHGYGATSQMWAGQLDLLSAGHRLIVWDMRGHGQTDSPDDQSLYSEAETVADMAAILDAEGVEDAVIGGLSLGGYMSLAFNVAHPERTRALMLFDTGPGYNNPKAREGWNTGMAIPRAESLERDGLAALGGSEEVRVSTHRSAEGLARAARGMLAQFDNRIIQSLTGIDKPTLVLVGENDEPFLAGTDYMANKIPGSIKVVVPNAGHAANIDNPADFNDAVSAFLSSLPLAGGAVTE